MKHLPPEWRIFVRNFGPVILAASFIATTVALHFLIQRVVAFQHNLVGFWEMLLVVISICLALALALGLWAVNFDRMRRSQAETAYRTLVDHSIEGLVILRDGVVIFANPPALRLSGYTLEELRSFAPEQILETIHPEDRLKAANYFQTMLGRGDLAELQEMRILSRDGATHWVEATGLVIDYQGKAALQVSYVDITPSKRAANALQASEQRYRNLFHNDHTIMFLIDPDSGKILDANPAACQFYGYTCEQFNALELCEIRAIPTGEHAEPLEQMLASGTKRFECRHRLADGELRDVEVYNGLVEFGDKSLLYAIVHDITDRKRVEEALRINESTLQSIVRAAPNGIGMTRERIVVWMNETLCQMLGYSSEELLEKSAQILYETQEEYARVGAVKYAQIRERGIGSVETRWVRKDGSTLDVLLSSSPVDPADWKTGVIFTATDITVRKQQDAHQAAIVSVSRQLRSAETALEMYPVILSSLSQVLHLEGAALALVLPGKTEVVIQAGIGLAENWIGECFNPAFATSQKVSAGEQTLYGEVVLGGTHMTALAHSVGLPHLVAVPMIAREAPIGILLAGKSTPFTEAAIRILEGVSEIAANAIQRASLHEQTHRSLHRLEALHKIDQAINSALDLRITLGVLLDQVISQLEVDAAAVLRYNPHLKTLEYAASRGLKGNALNQARLQLGQSLTGSVALERRIFHSVELPAGESDPSRAAVLSAEGLQTYTGAPLVAKGEIKGVLEVYHRRPFRADPEWLGFLDTMAGQTAIAIDNDALFSELQRSNLELGMAYDTTLEGWAKALELRDHETEGHSRRVTDLTLSLARELGVHGEDLQHIRRGALLHDIGKMGIPDEILHNPGPLTDGEWEIMRQHPNYAYSLLSAIPYLRKSLDIPYCHHERWDGRGYPRQLRGEQIPHSARIFAIVDVWDALLSDRPYRPAWRVEKALQYIQEQAGQHFDPQVAAAFMRLVDRGEIHGNALQVSISERMPANQPALSSAQ